MSAESQIARFHKHVRRTKTCWLWTGALHHNGYGQIACAPDDPIQTRRAHVLSWAFYCGNGALPPDGKWVLHECDVRACVRPSHLKLGTVEDNQRDMAVKGRAPHQKLTIEAVREIRASTETTAALARRFQVRESTLWAARRGVTWSHVV